MPNLYNAGQLASIIIKLGEKDIDDLGSDIDSQQSYIFTFMNIVMMKMVKEADNVEYSDSVTISADGYVSFTKSSTVITNMYQPKEIYMPNGRALQPRTSDVAPKGWYRESENQDIHIRGFSDSPPLTTGAYVLKYVRYPRLVTLTTDPVDIPSSGNDTLIKGVLSLIKYPKNSYQGASYMDEKAKESLPQLVGGATSAKGKMGDINVR